MGVFLLVFVLPVHCQYGKLGTGALEHWAHRMDNLIDFRYPVDIKVVLRSCLRSTKKCGQDPVKASRLSLGELNFLFTGQIRSERQ